MSHFPKQTPTPMIDLSPRRRIPIEKEREIRENQKKMAESKANLFNVLYGAEENPRQNSNQNAQEGNLNNDINENQTQANNDVIILNSNFQSSMIPSSARFNSNLNKGVRSELVKLKYPNEFFIYQDDPIVPQVLQQRIQHPREFSSLSPSEVKKQMIPPKLVIPQSKPNRNRKQPTSPSKQKQVPYSSRPAIKKLIQENQKDISKHQSYYGKFSGEIDEEKDDANEFLYLYDDCDYDINIIDTARKKLQEDGYFNGFSLYCNRPDFTTDWHPCKIVGISDDGQMVTIKFDNGETNADKEKVVHRISVRYEFESQERFMTRRNSALKTRKELDMICRIQSKFIKMSKTIKTPSNPKLLMNSLKRLKEEEYKLPIINTFITELTEYFIIAEAKFQYSQDWNDPFKRKDLKKEGLGPSSIYVPHLFLPAHLKKARINSIVLPNNKIMLQVVDLLMKFDNQDVFKEMFEMIDRLLDLNKFFDEVHFNLTTLVKFSQGQLYRKMYNLTNDMIEGKSQHKKEMITKMAECRLMTVLSNQVSSLLTNLPNYISDYHVKFNVTANESLDSTSPSFDDFLKIGRSEIEEIFHTFDSHVVFKIRADKIDEPLVVKTESMEKSFNYSLDKWTQFFTDDFNSLNSLFQELLRIAFDIPKNPFESLFEILPRDFYTVLMNNEKPIVSKDEINFDIIYQSLKSATKAIDTINNDYQPIATFKFIVVDMNSFFKLINDKFEEFKQFILRYLVAYGDYQVKDLLELTFSLQEKMSQPSNSVEHWHNKRCLIDHIENNFDSMNDSLNFVIKLIDFMAEFLYEPNQNYSNVYQAKIQLYQFFKSITKFKLQLANEKGNVTDEHFENKKKLESQLKELFNEINSFHFIKIDENDPIKTAEKLDNKRREFEALKNLSRIYKQRDEFLGCEITELEIIPEIEFNFSIFEPIWNIARSHLTVAEKWLTTIFTQLNHAEITETIQNWTSSLNDVKNILDNVFNDNENERNSYLTHIREYLLNSSESLNVHPLRDSVLSLIQKNNDLLSHVPILRELSNPALRARHWSKISEVIQLRIGTNEGVTWYWLIESGIESQLLLISSISRSAKMEYQIEKALSQMCIELSNLNLKTTCVKGLNKLDDPSSALELISRHRLKIQELFIPPYVQPFLQKVTDYEILLNNLKKTLKQTIEAQDKFDELQPALESEDIKLQAPELAKSFKEKVSRFNDFSKNLNLNISFHQIASNQQFVEMSRELNLGLDAVREDMKSVLEKKREIFPRFRFLSDSQLVLIISNSRTPSMTKGLFSLMYPAIKEAIIEDEQFCVGFKSFDDEIVTFNEKIWIYHNCVEKWHLLFDQQIVLTMKHNLRALLDQPPVDANKMISQFPSQIVNLYTEIMFTSMITKAYSAIENSLNQRKEESFNELFTAILNRINTQIQKLSQIIQNNYKQQFSNLLLILSRHKQIVSQILNDHLMTSSSNLWISSPKYFVDDENTNVTVSIAGVTMNYGFDYVGISSLPLYGDNKYICNSFALLIDSGFSPLICGPRRIEKTNLVINFAHMIGRQPFFFPCVSHSSFEKIQKMAENVSKINSFLVIKGLLKLKPDVLNQLSVMLLNTRNKRNSDCSIFATMSVEQGKSISEVFRVAFRPIIFNDFDCHSVLSSLFVAHGINDYEKIVSKIETLFSLFEKSFIPPLSSCLTPSVLLKIIRQKPFETNDSLELQMRQRLVTYFDTILSYDEYSQVLPLIEKVLGPIEESNSNKVKVPLFDYFTKSLDLYTGVIVFGAPLCGKSTLIEKVGKSKNSELLFINPQAIDFKELYGEDSCGLLGSLLQSPSKSHKKGDEYDQKWFVFDGSIENLWLDTLLIAFSKSKRLCFGDGSMFNLSNNVRFIFETSDISAATPTALSQCATVYISKEEVTYEMRLDNFLKELNKNSKIIEQLSNKIIGSTIDSQVLLDAIRGFSLYFIPQVIDFIKKQNFIQSLSSLHFINNYFTLLSSSVIEYYYVEHSDALRVKHSAEELIKDVPNLALFSLFWTFAAPFSDENRMMIDGFIQSLIRSSEKYSSVFTFKAFKMSDIFFNTETHQWEEWNRGLTSNLFIYDQETVDNSLDSQLTEMTPMHLLIPESILYPTLYITKTLITQNKNIMFCGSSEIDKSVISDLCFKSPYALKNLSPTTYLFQKNGTHHLLRSMVHTILPDMQFSPSFSARKPFLSLINFDSSSNSSAAELIRFITEHDYMYNTKTFVKEVTSGIRFLITTEEQEINQRLAHHAFVIQIQNPAKGTKIDTLIKSIKVLWNIDTNANVIASSLMSLLNESTKFFSFNIKHIFHLIHRVATVSLNKPPEFLTEAISHESVRVFYDPTHNSQILTKINQTVKHLSTVLKSNFIDATEITDKKLLVNFNSNGYSEYSINTDLNSIDTELNTKQITKKPTQLRYITSSPFYLNDKEILANLDPCLRMDVLRLARIVSLPRNHVFILTNLQFLPKQLLEGCQSLIGGEIHYKDNDRSVMDCFHDAFLKAGQTQTHQYLLIEVEGLSKEEKLLVTSLLNNYNVFGLFKRGEMLKILTKMYRKGESNSFGEETLEATQGYNELTSQFLDNCVTYSHWVLADHPPLSCPEFIEFASAFQPFFATDIALKSYIENEFSSKLEHSEIIDIIEPERLEALLTSVRTNPLFQSVPYTKSYSYSFSFLNVFIQSFNELCENFKQKKIEFEEIDECSNKLKTFLNDTKTSLQNMESDLVIISGQIEESMKQLEILNEITQKHKDKLEEETAILYKEETAAAAMKKECESEIHASKEALNKSVQELKGLSPRDLAVIKGMNHPPRGVLLIVRALMFILGNDKNIKPNETDEELTEKWPMGKKILNDPSFVSALIEKANNPLNEADIKKLKCICDDENFDPSIVERSSSAAKSICQFIRSLLPYYEANLTFKSKMKKMESFQENLAQLRAKHNEAMNKLNEANRESISLQNRQGENIKSKVSTEQRLKNKRKKIAHYTELYEMIEPLFNNWNEQKDEFLSFASIASVQLIMKLFYHKWASPLSNSKRIEFLSKLREIFSNLSIEIDPLIQYARNKTKVENDDIKALRSFFIIQSNQSVFHKYRFKYPVSENWLENALMLSIENKRWCIVEGLNQCPLNYLKQVCLTSKFTYISANSPFFENEFLTAIRENSFVLLFDFNFDSPSSLIVRTQQAMKSGESLRIHLQNCEIEEVNIDPSFIVFFDASTLTDQRIVRLDLGYVKIGFDTDDVRERIRFSLFETTDLVFTENLKRLENSLIEKEAELVDAQKKLKQFMQESNEVIFDDEELQEGFFTHISAVQAFKQEIDRIENERNELMQNNENSLQMATEIVSMFEGTEIIPHLWRIFENCLSSMQSFDFNKLKVSILATVIKEFGLVKTVPLVLKILSQNPSISEHDDEENIENNSIEKVDNFDSTIQFIEKRCPSILFNVQCPSFLLNEASGHKPVVLNSCQTVWLPSLLINYLNSTCLICSPVNSLKSVRSSINTGKVVISICSSLAEMHQLMPALSFVLSSSNYMSKDFAFIIVVLSDLFLDDIKSSVFPILNKCEVIKVDQPLHFGASTTSSIQSLSQFFKQKNLNGHKNESMSIDPSIMASMSLFDASANIFNATVHNGFYFNFCDTIIALDFIVKNKNLMKVNPSSILQLGKFLIDFLYATEFPNETESLFSIWQRIFDSRQQNLPFHISSVVSEKQMIFNFDLKSFGFSEYLDSYFKELNYTRWKKEIDQNSSDSNLNMLSICDNSNLSAFVDSEKKLLKIDKELLKFVEKLEVPSFWMNEKRCAVVHIISILARREKVDSEVSFKIFNLMSKPEILNFSLLFDPIKLLVAMRTNFTIDNEIDLNSVSLFLSSESESNDYSQKVKGLICVGAEIKNDLFVKNNDKCCHLPVLSIKADKSNDDQMNNDIREVDVFSAGQSLFKVKIKIDLENQPELIFLYIPTINDMFE